MPKIAVFIFFILVSFSLQAQIDSTRKVIEKDTIVTVVEEVKAVQDTVKKETKAERKAREKAEKERAKYYYKDILKDSARLHIEHLSDIAWKRSAILPGWGQITNGGKYVWIKLPIIYGGFITAYVVFDYWNWHYQKFTKEAARRIDGRDEDRDPDLVNYSDDGLIRAKDNFRRYRDMTILVTAVWWAGNVVEAYTDSMLRNRYNISDNLGLKINPTLLPTSGLAYSPNLASQFAPGVKFTFNF